MKKYLIMIMLSSFVIVGAYAQDLKTANVPKVVTSAFLAKYPESSKLHVAWEKEKANYEANWGGKSGEDNSALFTPTGTFIELVKAISINKLPAKALAYIKTNNVKITEAGLVTDGSGTVTYEAEIKGGKELVFDKDGNFIKKA
ncbi:MAG: PepSY-like domain-containing protein [Chitinophagaceae bacterium]